MNEIVLHPPKTQEDLGRVRGLSAGWRNNDIGARLIAAIEGAKPLGADELPERDPKRPGLTKDAALVSDLLKLLLKIRSKETGVAAKLIARSDDLEALAAGVRKNLNIPDSVLDNLKDAGSLYGPIIYQKAPIVMRQLEQMLGADELRDGLREYLARFAFSNATWTDLIAILDRRSAFVRPRTSKVTRRFAAVFATAVISNATALASCAAIANRRPAYSPM